MHGTASDVLQSRPPIILAIDSQEWTLRSFESVIGPRGYAVTRAYTGRQGLALLKAIRPDAILVGTNLPDMGLIPFLESVRTMPGASGVQPVIVTSSGLDSPSQRAELMHAGAWAVVTQPVDPEVFLAQLDVFVRAKMEHDQVRDAALVDDDTGFYSLRGLARRAREVAADAYRRSAPLACIVVAADSAGGTVQDEQAIRDVADALRRVSRSSDVIGRVGANQFAILVESDGTQSVEAVLLRLRQALDTGPDQPPPPNLAVGVAQVPNYRLAALPVDDLLRRATQAMSPRSLRLVADLPS